MIKILKVIIKIIITIFEKDYFHGIGVRQAFESHYLCLAIVVHLDRGRET